MKRANRTIKHDPYTFAPRREHPEKGTYWQARVYLGTVDGRKEYRTVWSGYATPEEIACIVAPALAEARIEAVEADRAAGRRAEVRVGLSGATVEDLKHGTVRMLVGAWLGHRQAETAHSAQTHRLDKGHALRLNGAIGDLPVLGLGTRQVEVLRLTLRESYAVSTTKMTVTALGTIWRWAAGEGIVPGPLDLRSEMKKLNHEAKRKPRAETGARAKETPELGAAWVVADHLAESAPQWVGIAFQLLLTTGGRIGEIAALTWGDIDGQKGTIRLRGKTGTRLVPATREALAPIFAFRPPDASDSDGVLGRSEETVKVGVRRHLKSATQALGLPEYTPHALRRLAVRTLRRAGVDSLVAAEIMGHSERTMRAIYDDVTDDEKQAAAAAAGLGVRPQHGENVVKLRRA